MPSKLLIELNVETFNYLAKAKSILTNSWFCVWSEAYEVHVSEVLPHCRKYNL